MNARAVEILGFLAQTGWDRARQMPLQADFSTRRFARLEKDDHSRHAILMDADPGQKTEQFVIIASLLRKLDISAPEIYAADAPRGLVLMEDFGDRNFGRMIDAGENAEPFYRRAADVLVRLHKSFDPASAQGPELPVFDARLFTAQAELFLEAYFVLARERAATTEETESFRAAWMQALKPVDDMPRALMLRDFMPDNLMDLSGRKEWRAAGILDFQDGGLGPVSYDLASLCETARRDIGMNRLDDMIDYYHAQAAPKLSRPELRSSCRILSAQRHVRILGIVARRALSTGQRDKLAYAPRIWKYLDELLKDETLKPVRMWMDDIFGRASRA